MNLGQLKKALPKLLKANLVPLIIGDKGTGKTQICNQIGTEMGFDRVINIRIGQMADVGDLVGLPYIENGITKLAHRDFFPMESEKVLIVLDEINRIQNKQILNALFELVEDSRKLGEYRLPKETRIIALCNPPTDDYSQTVDITDIAFKSRFVHLAYRPEHGEYLTYINSKKDFNSEVSRFLTKEENYPFIHGIKSEFSVDYMTPDYRANEYVSRFLNENPSDDIKFEVISGIVGQAYAVKFQEFLNVSEKLEPVKLEEVLEDADFLPKLSLLKNNHEMVNLTADLIINNAKERSRLKTQYTSVEMNGITKFLKNSNNEFVVKVMQDIVKEESFRKTDMIITDVLTTDITIGTVILKSLNFIKDGEEHLVADMLQEKINV